MILSSGKAELFLRGLQWDEGEGLETTDGAYGGGGYDSKQRPDMSNTQFLVEALKKAGVAEDDPAMQKALVFVSVRRTWNHSTTDCRLPAKSMTEDSSTRRPGAENRKRAKRKMAVTSLTEVLRMPD